MAAFEYIALTETGKEKKGVLEGDSAKAIRQSLREQGLTPLSINTTKGESNKKSDNKNNSSTSRS